MSAGSRKKVVTLLALIGVLAILIVCFATLGTESKVSEEDGTDDSLTTSPAWQSPIGAVSSFTYTYGEDVITLARTEEGWRIPEEPDFPLDEDAADRMASSVTEIETISVVDDPGDPEGYGFDTPLITIELRDENGRTLSLMIGDSYPFGSSRYMAVNGDFSVLYVVSNPVVDAFSKTRSDLLEAAKLPHIPSTGILGVNCSIAGEDGYELYISRDGKLDVSGVNPWVYREETGKEFCADTERLGTLFECLSAITFRKMVDYRADRLSIYGIGDDFITISYDDRGNGTGETAGSLTLRLGDMADDSSIYVNVEGTGNVFIWDITSMESITCVKSSDVQCRYIGAVPVNIMSSLSLSGPRGNVRIDVSDAGDESTGDGSGNAETLFMIDGVKAEGERRTDVRRLVYNITSLCDAEVPADPAGEAGEILLYAEFTTSSPVFPTYVIELRELNDSYCLATVNGERTCCVSRRDVMTILDEMGVL